MKETESIRNLMELKERVESLKESYQQSVGELNALNHSLKADYDCSSIEEAKELVDELKSQYNKLNKKIEAKVALIESLLEEIENGSI